MKRLNKKEIALLTGGNSFTGILNENVPNAVFEAPGCRKTCSPGCSNGCQTGCTTASKVASNPK